MSTVIVLKYRVPYSEFEFVETPISFIKEDGSVFDMSANTYDKLSHPMNNYQYFIFDWQTLIDLADEPFMYRGKMGEDFKWIDEHGIHPTIERINFCVEV